MEETPRVLVAGAGLAGCEAAWALAEEGIPVLLADSKPGRMSPAHRSANFGELVCSNSLKAARLDSAAGLLKEEMRRLGSLCMAAAAVCAVPAGGALAVDRERFSAGITRRLRAHPLIRVEERELTELPGEGCGGDRHRPADPGHAGRPVEGTLRRRFELFRRGGAHRDRGKRGHGPRLPGLPLRAGGKRGGGLHQLSSQ